MFIVKQVQSSSEGHVLGTAGDGFSLSWKSAELQHKV